MKYNTVKIGDYLYIKGRIGWKGLKKGEYLDYSDYRIINGKSLTENGIDWEECDYISKERYEESPEIMLQENDIVITKDGTIGKVDIIRELDFPTTVASGLFVLRNIRPDIFNTMFIYYILKSPYFKNFIESRKEGSVIPHLYQKDFVEFDVPLIGLEKQNKIVEILETIDKKINTNIRIINCIENIYDSLFKQWFIDFEFPNKDGLPYKSSGGVMVECELGEIPEGWNYVGLNEICEVKDGTHESPKQVVEGFPLVTSKHLRKNSIDFSSAKLISSKDFEKVNKRSLVERHDILISMIGTVGRLYLVQDKFVNFAIKNIGLIKSSKITDYEFIYCYLKSSSMKVYISERMAGSTQQYISLSELRKIPVIKPSNELLMAFKNSVNSLFEKIYSMTVEIGILEDLRDSLLPKLLSGAIEVPDESVVD
ncbi:restriction endonuclease subunit S [Bacillus marasmi]|uniref:restriction endonuclease subunit S n=1 Tax=Bacillus marasmi TaxID=1926279 RepID=UPI0011CA0DDC|nr:restriction endonuclease subunit S [Bacillus marasmi]